MSAGAASAGWPERLRAHRRLILIAAVALIALLGFEALRTVLAEVRFRDVRAALHAVAPWRIAAAIGFTALSYLALTLYDSFALRAIGRPLPWRTAALGSFTSYTLSHNLGLALLTGGSARYRVYTAAGLDVADVARVSLIASAAFWGGVFTVAAVALIGASQPLIVGAFALPPGAERIAGITILIAIGALAAARASGMTALRAGRFSLPVPPPRLMAAQIGVAAIDLLAASAALFVLVPGLGAAGFASFFLAYALALIVALLAHVPGGLGVFEAVILALAPGDRSTVFAALILYRMIYYLAPLCLAALLLGLIEGRRLRRPIIRGLSLVDKAGQTLAPPLIALLVFAGGLVLLMSGALPAEHGRLIDLADIIPLPFIEASHFAASLVGTALLLTAPALAARLESGFQTARMLLVGGILFSLFKGFDYEEAAILTVVALSLQYCRPAFYRRARINAALPDSAWLVAAIAAIALSLWAGFFAYKHVPYSDELWWRFALQGNAPRFLRASLGVGIALGAFLFWQLLSRAPSADGLDRLPDDVARQALAASSRSDAMLAFTGDKQFLVSPAGDAFLMYRVQGRSWVVMGDPVGPQEAWSELVWALRSACDTAHGRLCFYQVSEDMLPLLVDLGLTAMKYGEEALVPLDAFSLDGPRAKPLRHALRRADAAGLSFHVVPAAEVPALIPALRAVSDAWLAAKAGHEKRFSLGWFDPAYLARFDCAVVRRGESIVAFANLWRTEDRAEASVDLMRHLPGAPYGTMDYLFVRLIQWARDQGYERFNLGLAPLSGIHGGRFAPLWAKLATAVFSNGERLYGFAGLRAFKAKFGPVWVSRYVATPSGLPTARALIDLRALVGN